MNDDEPKIAETARFWRLNSLAALKMLYRSESEALDPEHLEKIKANTAELAQLQAQENTVQARYNRIKTKKGRAMNNDIQIFDNFKALTALVQKSFNQAAKDAVAENDRLGIPTHGSSNGKLIVRQPPPIKTFDPS